MIIEALGIEALGIERLGIGEFGIEIGIEVGIEEVGIEGVLGINGEVGTGPWSGMGFATMFTWPERPSAKCGSMEVYLRRGAGEQVR